MSLQTKTISMICTDSTGGIVDLTQTYDADTGWAAISYQYWKFLQAQGFILDHERVEADIAGFIANTLNP